MNQRMGMDNSAKLNNEDALILPDSMFLNPFENNL
jgi:hypothetical protein